MCYSKEDMEKLKKMYQEQRQQQGKKPEGNRYRSQASRQVVCTHCDNDRFNQGRGMLNTRLLTFLDLDWLDDAATILTCSHCGLVQWFGLPVQGTD